MRFPNVMAGGPHRRISLRCYFFRQLTHLVERETSAWENSAKWSGWGHGKVRKWPTIDNNFIILDDASHAWHVPVAICVDRIWCGPTHRVRHSR